MSLDAIITTIKGDVDEALNATTTVTTVRIEVAKA